MQKGYREFWRRLGRIEKSFLVVAVLYAFLRITGLSPTLQVFAALATFVLGLISVIRLARIGMRKAIWRLRNRLIVAYLFIAVVPIVLILALAVVTGWVVLGQVGVYLVRTELAGRERNLMVQADMLAGRRGPAGRGGFFDRRGPRPPDSPGSNQQRQIPKQQNPQQKTGVLRDARPGRGPGGGLPLIPFGGRVPNTGDPDFMTRQAEGVRFRCAACQVLITGDNPVKVPADAEITKPEGDWARTSGIILKPGGNTARLYLWAHSVANQGEAREAIILEPLTKEILTGLVPKLGDVTVASSTQDFIGVQPSLIPPAKNIFDIHVRGYYPVSVASWTSPNDDRELYLLVDTRISAVMGIILEQKAGQELQVTTTVQAAFLVIIILFLIVEIFSLHAGIKLSRSITGAVHELYHATGRVKEADFSYRIPVKGDDQLAELSSAFNTMTENLGQLIVVAKEKERLQSELEIAREVQNQLFPRDVPSAKTLELKGVCKPARVVSGDYYDFMSLPGSELAFAIGDVAGKGISAALLMATIQSTMRTQLSGANGAAPKHLSAAGLVGQLNRQLYANTTPEKYATFYFALYDEATHGLTYTNAGHLPPMLLRRGECMPLNPTGTVVGAFPFTKYDEKTVFLEDGDILVAYTDGIVEPENPYGEMFGENRLKDLVLRYAYADSSEIIARTMEAVNQWTASSELQDDMTMVVVRRI